MRLRDAVISAGCLLLLSLTAGSAQTLRDTMHIWKDEARSLSSMAASRAKFNMAAARADLRALSASAAELQVQLDASSAEARDFRARFVELVGAAEAASSNLGSFSTFRSQVTKIRSICTACRDKYDN